LDEGLARLLERTTDDDLVMLMSDHGHQACTRCATMDRVLEHYGFLEFGRGSMAFNLIRWGPGRRIARRLYDIFKLHGKISIPASPIEWSKSRAYTSVVSTGEGVSVNLKGREPEGIVEPDDYEKVRDEIYEALSSWRDPKTGLAPIAKIYRKEEVMKGAFFDTAPDLLLVPAPGYSLTHAKSMLEDADWLSGDHRLEGVLVATGPEVKAGPLTETAELIDLAPTAMAALGVPSGIPRDGKVLPSLVGPDKQLVLSERGPGEDRDYGETGLTSDEESEVEDHLRGLGYVE
jgi:predicted AlkP superfamily phosphohydrolase/phosphomutase